ncbi:hypothetical protein GALMADRAFT_725227 [Galerina marginata CBS 339.88]|uniref:Zinc-finger domain-containing protein n=1 Tax=Galerina marginata (strain CBS 339.88) TaxID=685588 RepID=A0A067ST43_GALM3|nr:hypothetical protein GALMADRAFT_725227 [Galerina marginata CBS 339.88]
MVTPLYIPLPLHPLVSLSVPRQRIQRLQAKDFGRIMPSAKALGKRKAVSPSSVMVSGSAPIPVSGHVRGVEADAFTPINDNINANPNAHPHTLDIFIHNYMPDPEINSGPSSSSNSIFAIRQSSTGFYSNMETLSSLNSPTHPQSQPQFRQEEREAALSSRGGGSRSHHPDSSRASQDSEKLFSESVLDNLGTRDQSEATDPWAESFAGGGAMHMDAQYTLSTINPTLLGGQTLDDQFSEPDLDFRADVVEDGEDENDPVVRRSQPPLGTGAGITALVNYSSSSGSSSASNPSEYEPSVATDPAVERTATKRKKKQPSTETTAVPARTLPRRHAQRQMTDMVPTDQLDAFLSTKQSEDSSYAISSDEDSGSDAASAVVVVTKSVSVSSHRAGPLNTSRRGSKKLDQVPAIKWPKTNLHSYCHQCRRKTDYLKMPCSCGKHFCVRCFAVRYPDEEFDVTPREFTCPACQGYCNCTICCSKRGETYVSSSRPDGHSGPPPGKRVTLGGKTNLPPLTLAETIPESGKYWSTIYSLTGERIGTTYIPSHFDGDPSVVFAPTAPAQVLDQPKSKPKRATKKKKIFVGQIQPSWNLEPHPKIKYVDSSSRSQKAANYNTRWYVGDRSFLKYIVEPLDKTGLLDDLSSLSSLEDDSMDESDSLEVAEGFTPRSLEDSQMSRVITDSLNACGSTLLLGLI